MFKSFILKWIFAIILFLLLAGIIILNFVLFPTPDSFPVRVKAHQPILIAHAGGAIDSMGYTNSLEAVERSMTNGYKFVELDLLSLKDSRIGAAHDFNHFNTITGQHDDTDAEPLSSESFESRRIYGRLHPLLGDGIYRIFKDTDVFLVTDKIANPELLEKEIPLDKDKILIETFTYNSYLSFLKKGYKYPMLNLWDDNALNHYWTLFKIKKVKIILISTDMMIGNEAKIKQLYDSGITIFVYASNDADLIRRHGGITVSGFYTDTIRPSQILE